MGSWALLTSGMQQQLVQDLIKRTGLNSQTIQGLLPILIPLALNLLQSGTNTQQSPSTDRAPSNNSVLSAFLDGDRDGDVDLGDALRVAGQFMNRR